MPSFEGFGSAFGLFKKPESSWKQIPPAETVEPRPKGRQKEKVESPPLDYKTWDQINDLSLEILSWKDLQTLLGKQPRTMADALKTAPGAIPNSLRTLDTPWLHPDDWDSIRENFLPTPLDTSSSVFARWRDLWSKEISRQRPQAPFEIGAVPTEQSLPLDYERYKRFMKFVENLVKTEQLLQQLEFQAPAWQYISQDAVQKTAEYEPPESVSQQEAEPLPFPRLTPYEMLQEGFYWLSTGQIRQERQKNPVLNEFLLRILDLKEAYAAHQIAIERVPPGVQRDMLSLIWLGLTQPTEQLPPEAQAAWKQFYQDQMATQRLIRGEAMPTTRTQSENELRVDAVETQLRSKEQKQEEILNEHLLKLLGTKTEVTVTLPSGRRFVLVRSPGAKNSLGVRMIPESDLQNFPPGLERSEATLASIALARNTTERAMKETEKYVRLFERRQERLQERRERVRTRYAGDHAQFLAQRALARNLENPEK